MLFLYVEVDMKLQNEKKETVYKYDLDCNAAEEAMLKKLAIERFAKDTKAQLEYAVLSILSEAVDTITAKELDGIKAKIKKAKKTS